MINKIEFYLKEIKTETDFTLIKQMSYGGLAYIQV